MRALWTVFHLIWRDQRRALVRGAVLTVVVLVMGAALLGLSGWFITAAAAAGLAGAGAVFDVFRPSAMVRFLALGRAAARYGERVLTHDATLRALESLRLRVLASRLHAPYGQMIRMRGAQVLNRLTADIDALDGVPLRLVLPVMAGVMTLALALPVLWVLVSPAVALWGVGGYLLGAAVVVWRMGAVAVPLSRRAELATQAFRTRLIDMIRGRRDLAVYGHLSAQAAAVMAAEARRLVLRRQLDRAERKTTLALGLLTTLVVAGTLMLGILGVQSGQIAPAFAALGLFAALAMAEVLAPLRRAASDLGRMADAARRVVRDVTAPPPMALPPVCAAQAVPLAVQNLTLHRAGTDQALVRGLSFDLHPGQTLALTGASGVGKSTVLLAVAGLHPLADGQILLQGQPLGLWPEPDLRDRLTLLPQRSALMAGSVAQALTLGNAASDERLWQVLAAVQLDGVIRARGGLDFGIGPRGEGLSGGEARRLVLARAVLRNPQVLVLDEPTEGLDETTAAAALRGLRQVLPDAAILIAAHRAIETAMADRIISLN
ncbi:amino acid ABC transporter ATP-binding/permease protein [Pseudotabrizicola sp. L79]|uniref:amino acid ABC transporter ATP-binding/permease protein n=1 Tax=Pseudotabrizicola sp. L79 TaxID=3118402 RepID=UPI002F935770